LVDRAESNTYSNAAPFVHPRRHGEDSIFRSPLIATLIGALMFAPAAETCTGIRLVAKDGGVVAARSLEFGFDLHSEVMIVPAGTALTGSLPDGGKGISYKTKYGFAGANAEGMTAIVDGINDQGLYVGLFYFPGYASYADATKENAARAMAPHEYANWLLGNFANVDEVKANFDKVVLVPVVVEAIGQAAPVHFVVHDRSGKAVVIEPLNKGLKIYDNPLGVVTNSPTFDWHMTNLRNYINLSATNVPPVDMGGITLAQLGQGFGPAPIAGRFHAAVAFCARCRVFAIGGAVRHRPAGRAAGLPHPQQFRHSLRRRAPSG
jgi:choloylglycine hydrolase